MVEVLPASRACRPSSLTLCFTHGPCRTNIHVTGLGRVRPRPDSEVSLTYFSSPEGTSGGGGNDDDDDNNNNSQPFHSHKFVN